MVHIPPPPGHLHTLHTDPSGSPAISIHQTIKKGSVIQLYMVDTGPHPATATCLLPYAVHGLQSSKPYQLHILKVSWSQHIKGVYDERESYKESRMTNDLSVLNETLLQTNVHLSVLNETEMYLCYWYWSYRCEPTSYVACLRPFWHALGPISPYCSDPLDSLNSDLSVSLSSTYDVLVYTLDLRRLIVSVSCILPPANYKHTQYTTY
ncbi:uncharacterized protein F5147DRAFT_657179 [Suillus discolor]|uniref:Uncharacterized protein n=1 Tax=Suillus discolor TaxID=1912936 RepID=A0A9P7EXG1_9AGAM|nr:uncharacterized protein F5147DRAFT_657179 [Suillus discolor]KAG2094418.1 hypothetical protein F5147DRAFT_657179 [Suillus discolor]